MSTPALAAVLLLVALLPTRGAAAQRGDSLPIAQPHDNRLFAGSPRADAMLIRMVARRARWFPASDSGPSLVVETLGEGGAPPRIPAPLVRLPAGTAVRLRLTNALPDTLALCGLPPTRCLTGDTLRVPPRAIAELRFTLETPGTSLYWAGVVRRGRILVGGAGGQLVGAVVVDAPRTTAMRDRILVLTETAEPLPAGGGAPASTRPLTVVNGKAWPHSAPIPYTIGDSARWRVLNGTRAEHPLHLHGSYFRVSARGEEHGDSAAAADEPLAVVEGVRPFASLSLAWAPDRAGRWLLHSHRLSHAFPFLPRPEDAARVGGGLAGPAVGIEVRPRGGGTGVVRRGRAAGAQRLRLLMQTRGSGGSRVSGFVAQSGREAPAEDSVVVPGPTLTLARGRQAEILVVNRLDAPSQVHWHGVEVDAYYDGIPGWSGGDSIVAPAIAPGDSFVVRFTPRRAGTFLYHAHADGETQGAHGMQGAIVVLEPGTRRDTTVDHLLVIGDGGARADAPLVLGGASEPEAIPLVAGRRNRLRLVNAARDETVTVLVLGDSAEAAWTPLARDGALLPRSRRVEESARARIPPGGTFDAELTPAEGELRLEVQGRTRVRATLRAEAPPRPARRRPPGGGAL